MGEVRPGGPIVHRREVARGWNGGGFGIGEDLSLAPRSRAAGIRPSAAVVDGRREGFSGAKIGVREVGWED